jgi:hypothetical protein
MATTVAPVRTKRRKVHTPRKWQRVSVSLPGALVSLEGERMVLVLNLCAEGAMIEMTMPPRLGSEVMLFCGGIEAGGSVVWQGSQHCGIRFHFPVEDCEIDAEALWSRTLLDRLLGR